jgi:hypothetical protein
MDLRWRRTDKVGKIGKREGRLSAFGRPTHVDPGVERARMEGLEDE